MWNQTTPSIGIFYDLFYIANEGAHGPLASIWIHYCQYLHSKKCHIGGSIKFCLKPANYFISSRIVTSRAKFYNCQRWWEYKNDKSSTLNQERDFPDLNTSGLWKSNGWHPLGLTSFEIAWAKFKHLTWHHYIAFYNGRNATCRHSFLEMGTN